MNKNLSRKQKGGNTANVWKLGTWPRLEDPLKLIFLAATGANYESVLFTTRKLAKRKVWRFQGRQSKKLEILLGKRVLRTKTTLSCLFLHACMFFLFLLQVANGFLLQFVVWRTRKSTGHIWCHIITCRFYIMEDKRNQIYVCHVTSTRGNATHKKLFIIFVIVDLWNDRTCLVSELHCIG